MKNTDFMNLSLPEGTDKIDIEILNNDFTAIENLLKQHAIIETMTLNGEGVIIGAIGPYIRLQNIDTVQVSIDIGKETYTLASGENMVIRETAENIGIITSGNVHITYFVNPKTYTDKEFYSKKKVDELLSKVEGNVEVDAELSDVSENPVQNKIITEQFSHYYTASETINAIIEKVAEIVAGAPEDFDTLKELSDWLKQHENSAATMNSAIQKNASDISTANTNITKNTTNIATANTAIQKNTTDIATANTAIQKNKTDIETANTNITKNTADISTANTNIQKNVDDISVANEQIADIYNRCGGGKNIFNFKNVRATDSYGNTHTKTDDSLNITDTTTVWARTPFPIGVLPQGRYRVSFVVSDLACESNTAKVSIATTTDGQAVIGISEAISQNTKYTFEFNVASPTKNNYIIFYGNYSNKVYSNKITFSEIMVSPVTVKDDAFTPYVPTNKELQQQVLSLQEQINSLIARIEALEGATTTEGGE